jgi:GrpB-like predicted nucleotidyltransferase (UPF0157 family)
VQTVIVEDYDPAWPRDFEMVRQRIWPDVADVALRIEHVGSTSVPGLAAKPIIDMTIVVASRNDVPKTIERLASLGYVHSETWASTIAKRSITLPICLGTISMFVRRTRSAS